MADIRINLLSTAPGSTIGDDFLPIDGTTNGTRKLSAFSPSFGGNVVVGGTLTAGGLVQGGGFCVPGNGAPRLAGTDSYLASTATTNIPLYVSGFTGGGQSADILRVSLNSVSDWFAVKGNGQVACYSTTASTGTSSGALVVGNGTSGGLGVGGAANIGGALTVNGATKIGTSAAVAGLFVQSQASGFQTGNQLLIDFDHINGYARLQSHSGTATLPLRLQHFGGDTVIGGNVIVAAGGNALNNHGYNNAKGLGFGIFARGSNNGWTTGLHFYSDNTDYSASWLHNPTAGELVLYTSASSSNYTNSDRALLINTSKQVQVLSSTNSTGIASGALLVSGGIGAAGAMYAGGNIDSSGGADFTSVAASFARISTVASAPRLTLVRSGSTSNRRAFDIINNADGLISMRFINDDLSGSTLAATISYTGDFRISGTLQVGNTYTAGAPTATGYIVIKDSTGTSYKIPAVAL